MTTKAEQLAQSNAIVWAAGLFDAKGTVTLSNGKPQVTLESCDEEIVRRFHKSVGIGTEYGPYQPSGRTRFWKWIATGETGARRVQDILGDHLSQRRKQQFRKILAQAVCARIT